MDAFEYSWDETLGVEIGYANVKGDRGGRTKHGITEVTFKEALRRGIIRGVSDVRDLTVDQAKVIAKAMYWTPLRLSDVSDQYIAAEIFDTSYNSGPGKAAMIAQLALDYLGEKLAIDGNIGPVTLGLINKWCAKDPRALMVALNGIQFIHFCGIVDEHLIDAIKACVRSTPDQQQFARGWTKRIKGYRES